MKITVKSYHLPFVHPGLNSYSRLEDHYNIMDAPNYAGQGTIVYAPQISADGRKFPNFEGLSAKWDSGAEYLALFPNVLLGIHRDHYFAIILTPDGPEKTHRTDRALLHLIHRSQAAHLTICGPPTAAMWRTVFAEDIQVVEGMQKGRARACL